MRYLCDQIQLIEQSYLEPELPEDPCIGWHWRNKYQLLSTNKRVHTFVICSRWRLASCPPAPDQAHWEIVLSEEVCWLLSSELLEYHSTRRASNRYNFIYLIYMHLVYTMLAWGLFWKVTVPRCCRSKLWPGSPGHQTGDSAPAASSAGSPCWRRARTTHWTRPPAPDPPCAPTWDDASDGQYQQHYHLSQSCSPVTITTWSPLTCSNLLVE